MSLLFFFKFSIEILKKDSETKIRNLILDNAINGKLAKVDDKYKKLLQTQFDREKLTIKEDGTIEGLEEQFKTINETYSEWFEEQSPGGSGFNPGGEPPQEKGDSAKQFMDAIFNNQLRK